MDRPPHEICFRYLTRVLQHAQKRDEDGTFNDKETREAVVHAWKMFLNCPKPPGWIPGPPEPFGTLRYRCGNTTSEE